MDGMVMYKKILAAIENSPRGDKIFATALELAEAVKADLKLLNVLSPEEEYGPVFHGISTLDYYPALYDDLMQKYRKEWEEFLAKSRSRLENLTNQSKARGVNAEYSQNYGSPGRTICEVAEEWQADLIVMGHRGLKGITELIQGSASNYVMHHAKCSVLIVKTRIEE
jgi:Universal stress protein UspA and related nucleotide-binding proteins